MTRIVFLDRDSLPVPLRQPDFPHQWVNHAATTPAQLLDHCRGADVLVSNKVVLNADTLAALPDLKLIAVAATGVNNIDLASAQARGIPVCNIRGYAETTVPEHALMLMLALMRNLPAYQRDVAAGAWQQSPHFCHFGASIRDLRGRTLLIVGAGTLGRGTARLAEAFGMQVQFAEHKGASVVRPGHVDFAAGLSHADIVSIHCPLNAQTRGLIGAADIAQMRQGAVLINTARGGIVDEAALLAALRCGHLGGAGFDVLHEEPPRSVNPLLEADLANLIITPHVGWASFEAMSGLADQLVGNIECWATGTPRHLVNA